MRKLNNFIFFLIFIFVTNLFSQDNGDTIDWVTGKIYSSISVKVKNDYNVVHNRTKETNNAREKAKLNYYSILKNINIYESISVLEFIEKDGIRNRDLFTLIDNAKLKKIEYPDLNTIKVTYFIDIYGANSLMSILMNEKDFYTEDLKSYMDFNYETNYTGVIIDARGELLSFDGHKVKIKPSIFVTIKDSEGKIVFNQFNVLPNVMKERGMVRFSYDITENLEERVGKLPLKTIAFGTGDKSGSVIVVSKENAKKMLSSEITRDAIKNGKIAIIIDKK
ncbi:MAG TPA: hypothetical protein PK771_08425 [Spirochaetota bacterium]|nr:hypothetical protein [Spirochaetota bacterium]